jgi:UDP-2-acetamido-3-amino-2,3-dideoxy-glucuronate N-acetyltransferase
VSDARVHRTALVDGSVGADTTVWAFTHLQAGAIVGANCNVGEHCFIENGAVVGDRCTVKNGVAVWRGVTLDEGVFVGPGVVFTNDLRPRSPRMPHAAACYEDDSWLVRTTVERGATIGGGAVILAGITIGTFAMVGAGAVVTRDVAPHSVVVGNPARTIGFVCECGRTRNGPCPTCSAVTAW